jgi:hypothetical protein
MDDPSFGKSHLAKAARFAAGLARDVPPAATPLPSNAARGPFDVTYHLGRLCADICARLPDLAHVDMRRVGLRFCQTRNRCRHGMQASLTPLRFAGGEALARQGARWWTIERLFDPSGRELLYLLSFYMPRFLNQSFREKLTTVFHELWHIGPQFDGDMRRHEGRCYAHGPSEREFHAAMDDLADRWLSFEPPPETYEFLAFDFAQLVGRHGRVCGTRIATPKLKPVAESPPSALVPF